MLNPDNPNVQIAVFGKQVEDFLKTDIGVYLLSRAEQERKEAIEELKEVDPTDPKAVMKAQNKVKVAESFLGWLGDAIADGQSAYSALHEVE